MQTSHTALDIFLDQSPDRFFIADLDGKLLRRRGALARELPSPEGEGISDLTHPEDLATRHRVIGGP